ncbi:hypothetical protein ANN_16193, partial [Periplaneta americana]
IRMNEIHLWFGLDKLSVAFEPSDLPNDIIKICKINHHMFALTRNNSIYHSEVNNNCDKLVFTNTNISAIDIACNTKILYFVNDNGQVFKTTPEDLDAKEEIVLKEDAKCCSHGYKTSGHKVKVKSIAAEECSCLYVTENGQLWVSGDQPKLGLQDEAPQKVTFFEKRFIISVACGAKFSIALAYKPGHFVPENGDSDTDDDNEGDVFVSNCPLCISSPISQQSTSDTCPLGLHVQQTSDEHCSTSTTSKENTAEDKKSTDDSTSGSTDGKGDVKGKLCNLSSNHTESEGNVIPSESSQNPHENDGISRTDNLEQCDLNDGEIDCVKEEKKNEFFINTEAARQFLTRQLSWVSSYGGTSEDLVECAEASLARPSQIIKQNMSSVASLVYEGVKTVGDRGATLFRHMSGGSETSESVPGGLVGCESFEELSAEDFIVAAPSITSSLRCEESFWSSSCGTSERGEESDVGISERVTAMVRAGTRLLSTELWSWGDITHGQLGIGDTVKRTRPTIIARLTGIGVCRIACGLDHALAVTLDGRVFAWGRNNHNQVSLESHTSQSTPQQLCCVPEKVRSVVAGDNHSLVITYDDNVYYLGKGSNKSAMKITIPSLEGAVGSTQKQILSSRHISGCLNTSYPTCSAVKDLAIEQTFLEETLLVHSSLIKPLQKKGAPVQETNVYDTLCACHSEILSFACLNVQSLREYTDHGDNESNIMIIQNVDEYIRTYRNYLTAVCDVVALSGYAHIARLVDVPHKMFTMFHEPSKKNKKSQEAVVSCALLHPLKRLKSYKSTIQLLLQCNESRIQKSDDKQSVERKLRDALIKWEQFWEEQEQKRNEADTTRHFWESAGRLAELLRSPERRLIRESRSHPLSVINSGRFSSHWFVLFTDIFVHVSGGSQNVHPLPTMWVDVVQDTETVQNGLQLTMPEETLMVHAPTAQDKMEWLQSLQGAIKKSLQKHHSHIPPTVRNAKYTFTKHHAFKDAKYTGRWCNGKLQGPGRLEWPDGKVYVGQFQNGQMNGIGRMEIPGISTYEGQWKDGQQDGYGIIKYINGDVYEGHFKDGVAHGHGLQKQGHFMASVASVYIGEWVNGVKQGYGVMDDIVTGEKYLGYWSNNLKHGCGLIVTLDGIYYEGVFMQDTLTGHGVMVFEDGTHYEGEFRAAGVFSGKGTLTFNSGDRIEGSLHGAWNEGVKITGTLLKNTTTPQNQLNTKPSSFGKLCVAANQKWKAIFRQCYQQLGIVEQSGGKGGKTNVELHKVWENVAVLINNSQQERGIPAVDQLDTIPQFGRETLDQESYQELRSYLVKPIRGGPPAWGLGEELTTHHRKKQLVTNPYIKPWTFEVVEKFKYLGATVTNINDTWEEIKRRINMGNACYYSVEKLLSSSLLSKNLKVRIYKTVILPVVLYGCETWTLTLREEHGLRVFENKVVRKIFGAKRDEVTGEWRKLHNAELHALYSSPDIIRNIKSRRLRWAGHVACMGESRNAYRVSVGRPEGKRPLGRPRRRWEDNIKMDLREVGYDDRDWINLAQDRDRWRAYVRAAINLRVP